MAELSRRDFIRGGTLGAAVIGLDGVSETAGSLLSGLNTATSVPIPRPVVQLLLGVITKDFQEPTGDLSVAAENLIALLSDTPYSKEVEEFALQALGLKAGMLKAIEADFGVNVLNEEARMALDTLDASAVLRQPEVARAIRRLNLTDVDWRSDDDPHTEIASHAISAADVVDENLSSLKKVSFPLQTTYSPNPLIRAMIDDLISVIRNPSLIADDPLVRSYVDAVDGSGNETRCVQQYLKDIEEKAKRQQLLPVHYFTGERFRYPLIAQDVSLLCDEDSSITVQYFIGRGESPKILAARYITEKGITGDSFSNEKRQELASLVDVAQSERAGWHEIILNEDILRLRYNAGSSPRL